MRIAVCNSQVPFEYGGAEILADALVEQLRARGHETVLVQLPQSWHPKENILKNYLMWRLVDLQTAHDLQPIDRVITLKYPAYAVSHKHKITWLVHQLRQAYDMFGTEHCWFDNSSADQELREQIRIMDTRTIRESKGIYSISKNVAGRLARYNQVESQVLYPPPAMDGRFHNDDYGDFVLSVSRLNALKRVDHLVRAMGYVRTPVRCVISGRGPDLDDLRKLAVKVGAQDRIDFLGFVANEELLRLYACALALYYAPVDEDYGLATVEAMKSAKPVLTTNDSGGVLEFVQDGITGYITPSDDPATLGERIDRLYAERTLARRLGEAARSQVSAITWDRTIDRLLDA
ncbi:MAG: glycosyltransferase family 4 protein [Anaerolineae bacterium]|nr:glycosyltransferase family 4 protein [Anaerolineae bacterium]